MPISITYNKPLTDRLLSLYHKELKDLLTVDLFSVYLLSRVDIVIRYIEVDFTFRLPGYVRYIEVDFTFGLPNYVCYIEEFVISRFVISRLSSIHFTVTFART